MKKYLEEIEKMLGESLTPATEGGSPSHEYYGDDIEGSHELPDADELPDYDVYINSKLVLPQDGDHMISARVIGQSKSDKGNIKGIFDTNPILDTQVCNVMFPDGSTQQYAVNIIAENLYSQVDEDGCRYQLLDSIIDHKTDGKAIK